MLAGKGSNASRQVKMTSRSPSPGISEILEVETPRALPSLSSKTAERKTFLTAKSDWFCAKTRKRPPVSELEKSCSGRKGVGGRSGGRFPAKDWDFPPVPKLRNAPGLFEKNAPRKQPNPRQPEVPGREAGPGSEKDKLSRKQAKKPPPRRRQRK